MGKFVNLTPHAINAVRKNGTTLTLPPSGWVARVGVERVVEMEVEGVELAAPKMGALQGVEGLEVKDGDILVTSLAAKTAVKAAFPAALVVSPGALIRDAQGQTIGCQGFDL